MLLASVALILIVAGVLAIQSQKTTQADVAGVEDTASSCQKMPVFTNPTYVGLDEASEFVDDGEMVMVTLFGSRNLAYPVKVISPIKVVNDEIDGIAFAATFCDVCNSGLVFNRLIDEERVVTLASEGSMYEGAMVMYDQETESLWPQSLGSSNEGGLEGTRLDLLSATMMTFEELQESYPEALVLSES